MNSKIFETKHPFKRGESKKTYYNFKGALGILIEFDNKCEWDIDTDKLRLRSLYGDKKIQ